MIKIFFIRKFLIRLLSFFIPNKTQRQAFRKKQTLQLEKSYLKKYLYALEHVNTDCQENIRNKIWVCWFQGEENAPEIVKRCIASIRKYAHNMEVVVLNDKNLQDYCRLPEYILMKRKKGLITPMQYSDLIRATLLSEHGGIWIDATVLLTGDIPQEFFDYDFFCMQSNGLLSNVNWFISAKKGNVLIVALKNFLYEYWKHENKLIDYFLYPLAFDFIIENNNLLQEEWKKLPCLLEDNCYWLQNNLFTKFSEEKWQEAVHFSNIHKLTYKYKQDVSIEKSFLEFVLDYKE